MVTPIPPDPRGRGGIPLVLDGQLRGLLARHDVEVLTVAGPEEAELASVATLRREGVTVHTVERREPRGAERWRRRGRFAAMWSRGDLPWRTVWYWDGRVQTALDELLVEGRFDLVAVEDNAMAAYRYPSTTTSVLTEHEVRRPRPVAPPVGGLSSLPRWALAEHDWRRWPRYQRRVWGRFERLHVFGRRDEAAITEMAPELRTRVHRVPFGLTLPLRTAAAAEDPDSLLFIGNFTHAPNVDGIRWFVESVFEGVRRRRPSARLTIAGALPPEEVASLAGPAITLIANPDDVEPLIESAAVVLAPLRIGGGMRVKVVQALGRGKAVVATTRATEGLPLSGGAEPLVVSDDPAVLAERISILLVDDRARKALGTTARRFAEEHLSAAAYGARLDVSYTEAVDRHRQGR